MPWWGIAILCFACLEMGFLFGHAIGKGDKYKEDLKEDENDIQET